MSRSYGFLLLAALLMTFVKPAPPADNRPPGDERVLTVELVEEGEAVIEEEVVEEIITEEPPPPPPGGCSIEQFPGNPAMNIPKPCVVTPGVWTPPHTPGFSSNFQAVGIQQQPFEFPNSILMEQNEWGDILFAFMHTRVQYQTQLGFWVDHYKTTLLHAWFDMTASAAVVRYANINDYPPDGYSMFLAGIAQRGSRIAVTGGDRKDPTDYARAWIWSPEQGLTYVSDGTGIFTYGASPHIDRNGDLWVIGTQSPNFSTNNESWWIIKNQGAKTIINAPLSPMVTSGVTHLRSDASGKLYAAGTGLSGSPSTRKIYLGTSDNGTDWEWHQVPWFQSTVNLWEFNVTPSGIAIFESGRGLYTWSNNGGASWSSWIEPPIPGNNSISKLSVGVEQNGCRVIIQGSESRGAGDYWIHYFTVPIQSDNTLGTHSASTTFQTSIGTTAGFDRFGNIVLGAWTGTGGVQLYRKWRADSVTIPPQP